MNEVARGVHRWVAPHPSWEPGADAESPGDWPQEVGCVLYHAPAAAVLIDPLVPDPLWPALDERIAGRPVVVLTTMRFHGRSRDAVLERYGGVKVPHDGPMPAGVEAVPVEGFDETMYWPAAPRAPLPGGRRPPRRARSCRATGSSATAPAGCGCARRRGSSTCPTTTSATCGPRCSRCSTCPSSMCWSRTASR